MEKYKVINLVSGYSTYKFYNAAVIYFNHYNEQL